MWNDTTGAKIGDFIVEYLRKFEAICKKDLTRESGAQVGLFDEKTRGWKSHDTDHLKIEDWQALHKRQRNFVSLSNGIWNH
jgi:hypothetical protein